jgi:hypothetical protein
VPVVGPRFLIEAGFIIAVAVVAGVQRLGTLWIVAVMAGAWLIVAAAEISISRHRAKKRSELSRSVSEPATTPSPLPRLGGLEPRASAPTLEPVAPVRLEPEPEVKPERERPRIAAVPEPAPLSPPEPEPAPAPGPDTITEPEPSRVVALKPINDTPREWNLWELERIARDHASGDVARDEELSYLLMYLREFAGPDGVLPSDFDALVRDAFGDVLHSVAR